MASSQEIRTFAAHLIEHDADMTTFMFGRGNRVKVPNSLLSSECGDAPLHSTYLMDVRGDDALLQVMRIRPMPGGDPMAAQAAPGPSGSSPALPLAQLQRPPRASHLEVQVEGKEEAAPPEGNEGALARDSSTWWAGWDAWHHKAWDFSQGDPWQERDARGATSDPWSDSKGVSWRTSYRSRSQDNSQQWGSRAWERASDSDAWASWVGDAHHVPKAPKTSSSSPEDSASTWQSGSHWSSAPHCDE